MSSLTLKPLALKEKVSLNPNEPPIVRVIARTQFAIAPNSLEEATDQIYHACKQPEKSYLKTYKALHLGGRETSESRLAQFAASRQLCQVLPPLTGPHKVGHTSFSLELPNQPLHDQKVEIDVFAPTKDTGNGNLLMRLPPGHPLESVLNPIQKASLFTHAQDGLDPTAKRPCLIYSPGLGVDPAAYRPMLEEWASHGYVILSVNHPSSSQFRGDMDLSNKEFMDIARDLWQTQTNNIRYIVNQIHNGAVKEVKDIVIPQNIVLGGHSLGGAASIEAADAQTCGCFNIDGMIWGKNKKSPTLMIIADKPNDLEEWSKEEQLSDYRMEADWAKLHPVRIEGINHMDFSIFPLLRWMAGEETQAIGIKAHKIATQEVLTFMKANTSISSG